jgi:3-methyl-2-oxobutanoate hydroxymethyltransferase
MSSITATTFQKRKDEGEKIAVVTAYDFPSAQLINETAVDAILVGDSLGNVVQGMSTTLGVTMEHMLYHVGLVSRAAPDKLIIGDLPFMSYQVSPEEAIRNAGRLVAEAGAQAVKLEGPASKFGEAIRGIVRASIPFMGHIGLTPQSIHQIGGYKVQGRTPESRQRLKEEALGLEEAGAFAIVLECMPCELAREITESLTIPTIGIGAGPHCDGQVLVFHDMLGWGKPRFTKTFADARGAMRTAFEAYATEVKAGTFPAPEHGYPE